MKRAILLLIGVCIISGCGHFQIKEKKQIGCVGIRIGARELGAFAITNDLIPAKLLSEVIKSAQDIINAPEYNADVVEQCQYIVDKVRDLDERTRQDINDILSLFTVDTSNIDSDIDLTLLYFKCLATGILQGFGLPDEPIIHEDRPPFGFIREPGRKQA